MTGRGSPLSGPIRQFTTDFTTAEGDVKASDALLRYLRTVAEFASPKGTLDCIGAFARTDFRDDLTRVTVPILVIHGDSDAVVPCEVSGRRTHETITHSSVVVIEGGPHGINASHADEFNNALLHFLGTVDNPAQDNDGGDAVSDAGAHRTNESAAGAGPATAATLDTTNPSSGSDAAAPESTSQHSTDAAAGVGVPSSEPSSEPTAEPVAAAGPAAPSDVEVDRQPEPAAPTPVAQPATVSTADPSTEAAPIPADDQDKLGLTGLVWSGAGTEEDDIPADRPGQVADPDLGDIPVDQQPRHRG